MEGGVLGAKCPRFLVIYNKDTFVLIGSMAPISQPVRSKTSDLQISKFKHPILMESWKLIKAPRLRF